MLALRQAREGDPVKRLALVVTASTAAATAFLWFLDQAYRLGRSDANRLSYKRGWNDALDATMTNR